MTTTQAAPQAHVNLSSAELIERAASRPLSGWGVADQALPDL